MAEEQVDESYFEARPLHEICEIILQQNASDAELMNFCRQAIELEVRILLAHALQKAWFNTGISHMAMGD
jgi:hypothetical protein